MPPIFSSFWMKDMWQLYVIPRHPRPCPGCKATKGPVPRWDGVRCRGAKRRAKDGRPTCDKDHYIIHTVYIYNHVFLSLWSFWLICFKQKNLHCLVLVSYYDPLFGIMPLPVINRSLLMWHQGCQRCNAKTPRGPGLAMPNLKKLRFDDTLPETHSAHLEMDGWSTIVSFWEFAYFHGRTVSFREGNGINYLSSTGFFS